MAVYASNCLLESIKLSLKLPSHNWPFSSCSFQRTQCLNILGPDQI